MPRQAVEHLLHTARRHLGMEGAFLAELTETEQIYQATSGAESFNVHEGGSLPPGRKLLPVRPRERRTLGRARHRGRRAGLPPGDHLSR